VGIHPLRNRRARFGGSLRMGNLLLMALASSTLTIYTKTALVQLVPPILGWRRRCTRRFLLLVRHGPPGEPKKGQVTYQRQNLNGHLR
jgi:hypothetical protein